MRIPTENFFRQQLNQISDQYENLNRLYMLQVKQHKILNAADDPVLASNIQTTQDFIDNLSVYAQSQTLAKARTQLFETSITDAVNSASSVKTLILQAEDFTLPDTARAKIADSLAGELRKMLAVVNTQDANGSFIYSGYNSTAQPFVQQGNQYQYQGGYNTASINIGPSATALYNEVGYNIFGNIPLGNGNFTVNASSTNTGSASTTNGSVVNSATYVADNYTISFVSTGGDSIGYQVVDTTTNTTVVPTTNYTPDSDITFNGLSLNIKGKPNAGDSFQITPNQNQDVFDSLQSVITALRTPISSGGVVDQAKQAQLNQILGQASGSFEQAFNQFTSYLGQVGNRMQAIDGEKSIQDNLIKNERITLHELEDADLPELASKINQQLVTMQATQDTYMELQKTLMELMKV